MPYFQIEFQTMDGTSEIVSNIEAESVAATCLETIKTLREIMAEHLTLSRPLDIRAALIRDDEGLVVSEVRTESLLRETFVCLQPSDQRPPLSIVR